MKTKSIIFLLLITAFYSNAQQKKHDGPIHWMSFEEAVEKNKTVQKKFFIDVYTHWCGWCKRMDATTFKDSVVAVYMNEKYHAVKLDAERKDTVQFFDKTFVYKPELKANELAVSLLNSQMSYPSFVFLDEKYGMLSPLPGYQSSKDLLSVLRYFGENIYVGTKWEDYNTGK